MLAFVYRTDYNISTLLVVDVGSTSIGMLHASKHVCGGNEHRKRNFTPRRCNVNYSYATYNILHTIPQESTGQWC